MAVGAPGPKRTVDGILHHRAVDRPVATLVLDKIRQEGRANVVVDDVGQAAAETCIVDGVCRVGPDLDRIRIPDDSERVIGVLAPPACAELAAIRDSGAKLRQPSAQPFSARPPCRRCAGACVGIDA